MKQGIYPAIAKIFLLLLSFCLIPGILLIIPDERGIDLEYTLIARDEEPDHIHINARITGLPGGVLRLVMTQNYGRLKELKEIIPEIIVRGADDKPAAIKKTSEFLWEIGSKKHDSLVLEYIVHTRFPYSSLNSVRLPYRDSEHIYFPAASVFIHPEEEYIAENSIKIQRIWINFDLPKAWIAATSWGISRSSCELSPPSLENLNFGLIGIGKYRRHSFKVRELPVDIALLNPGPVPDDEIVRTVEKALLSGHNLFGFFPVPRLFALCHFIYDHPGQASGNKVGWSINMNCGRTLGSSDWLNKTAVIFGEIFHFWNGTEDSPISRAQSDHSLIWFTEGVTRFYEFKNMLKSEIISEDTYYKYLSDELNNVYHDPRRDESLKAISEKYYSDPKSMSLTYSKGCCLAFALDSLLQHSSSCQKSFDDVMKRMLEKYDFRRNEHCYTHEELDGVFREVLGEEAYRAYEMLYGGDFIQAVESVLNAAGLRLEKVRGRKLFFGIIDFGPPYGPLKAYQIDRDSPAYLAGLREQDILVEINGQPLNDIADIKKALRGAAEGDSVVLLINRNGRKMKIRTPWASDETRVEVKTNSTQKLK